MRSFLTSFSKLGTVLVAVLGAGVLLGWAFDVQILKSVYPGFVTMKPNTAAGFLMAGLALWALIPQSPANTRHYIGLALAVALTLLGGLTLFEILGNVNLGIDQLIHREDPSPVFTSSPGRMAPPTAINFILIGISILLIDVRRFPRFNVSQWLAGVANAISMLSLVGYVFGVQSLYGLPPFTSTALHTAAAFWLISLSVLASRPDHGFMPVVISDTAGGLLARRLLLLIVPSLFVLGWLSDAGQRAGWYDSRFAEALMALSSMIVAAFLIAWQARSLHDLDLKREQAEMQITELNVSLERRVRDRTQELEDALSQVKSLQGMLPMCAWCRKIRDDNDYWRSVEEYISHHTEARFSHGICPECEKAFRDENGL